MDTRDFEARVDITNFEQRMPVMNEKALLRSQERILDLAPGEIVLARAGSVNWDSYGAPGEQYFTLDTWNDYQTDGITPSYMSYMPIVMKACVATNTGELRTDFIVDLRYIDNITNINRPMEIDLDNPESSYLFRHFRQTRGAIILNNLLLPGIDGPTLWWRGPLFGGPAIDLSDKVNQLFLEYFAKGKKPQAIQTIEVAPPAHPSLPK